MTISDIINDMPTITDDWTGRSVPGWVWGLNDALFHVGPMTPYGEQMAEIADKMIVSTPSTGGPLHRCPECGTTWDCGTGDDCTYEELYPCIPCQRSVVWDEAGLRVVEP